MRERDTGYDIVLFGTGDREDPFNTTTVNWVYAFRDTDVISGKSASEIITSESALSRCPRAITCTVRTFSSYRHPFISRHLQV